MIGGMRPLLLLACAAVLAAAEAPLGSKDFYPSAKRSLGYRGDGNGCFPGATPVTGWSERTPAAGEPQGSRNVVWRSRVPGWSDTQCLVIGDRVVGLAEPDWIFCLDARDGHLLWRDRVRPMFLGPPPVEGGTSPSPLPPESSWRRQQVIDIARAIAVRARPLGANRPPYPGEAYQYQSLGSIFALRERICDLDPDPAIRKGCDALVEGWLQYLVRGQPDRVSVSHLLKPVMARYRIALDQVWFGWVGTVQSTPVTDGETVYAAFGQGMVAAYDLAGRRRWAWREVDFELKGKLYCDHTPSLLLVDGVLLVRNHFGDLMGIDPATGRIRYQTDIGRAYNHGAYTTPGVLRLASPGGESMTAIVTQHDKIIEVQSGRIVAAFDTSGFRDIGHGQPRMVHGDLVLIQSSQTVPPDHGPAVVLRVALADDGSVSTERVHAFGGMHFGNSPMALTRRGEMIGHNYLWDFRAGEAFPGSTAPERNEGGGIVIAGRYAFNCVGARRPEKGWRTATFGCYDLGEPGTSTEVAGTRSLAWEGAPPEVDPDEILPGLEPAGKPGWFGLRNGGLSPSGNRLFGQTFGWVYCLGDPAVPYDWNPASRPAALTAALERAAAEGIGPTPPAITREPTPPPTPPAGEDPATRLAAAPAHELALWTRALLVADGAEAALDALGAHLRSENLPRARRAAWLLGTSAEEFSAAGLAREAVGLLLAKAGRGPATLRLVAIHALGAYGSDARRALDLLRGQANSAEFPGVARRAMHLIDPDASTEVGPGMSDPLGGGKKPPPEDEGDDLLDFPLD